MNRDYWPTTEWRSATPETMGMDSAILKGLDSVIKSQYRNLLGILIVRKGYVVFEKYFHHSTPKQAHNVASVTKSITSALVGIAINGGYIRSVDEKVLDFFPEYDPGVEGGLKHEITLRHLLTMTAPYPFPIFHEPLDRLRRQPDWVRFSLDMLGKGGRPGSFKYSTAGVHLLSAILTRTTGQCARAFANEHLFRPTGMREIPHIEKQSFEFKDIFGPDVSGWLHDPDGNTSGGFGLTLTIQDMARFGFLYINKGQWDGRQVVSRAWIEESTAMNKNKYGYLWWLGDEDGVFAFLAKGDGGNMICCVPEKDLVVATASTIVRKPRDRWELVKNYILSAVKN